MKRTDFDTRMTIGEHLEELRQRLIRAIVGLAAGMALALAFGKYLMEAIKHPYVQVMKHIDPTLDLTVLEASGGFVTYMKVCLYAGLVLSSPWVFYQIWMFVAAGLRPNEKRYVMLAVPFCSALFIAGALFFVFGLAQYLLGYFIAFNRWLGLRTVLTFQNHVSFMVNMMLVFGLAFQTPVIVLLLARMGLVTLSTLQHYRRHIIIVIVFAAAVLTPPDVFSQIALAVPMWGLYELGVLLVYLIERREARARER